MTDQTTVLLDADEQVIETATLAALRAQLAAALERAETLAGLLVKQRDLIANAVAAIRKFDDEDLDFIADQIEVDAAALASEPPQEGSKP